MYHKGIKVKGGGGAFGRGWEHVAWLHLSVHDGAS